MDFNTVQTNVNLAELFAQLEQNESAGKKSAQAMQRIASEKMIRLTQENIQHLRQYHSQLGRAAWFSFAFGMLGTLAQAVNAIAPGVGAAVSRALGALAMVSNTLNQLNPFASAAQQSQVKAQEYDALAKVEDRHVKTAEDQVQQARDHRRQLHNDLEKILENQGKTQEAAVRA